MQSSYRTEGLWAQEPFNTMKTGPEGGRGGSWAATKLVVPIILLSLCPPVPKGIGNTCRARGDGMAWWPSGHRLCLTLSLAFPGTGASLAHSVALRPGWASSRGIQKGTGATSGMPC